MINVEEKKAKIIEVIKFKGPSLPIQVAREIELSSLFTSAIMSEMISNKTIKVSNLKIGGSPLYYLRGQEGMLENFSSYLGQKEKEAFLLLKEKTVLQDDALQPAYRVAIRSIRDFAIPLKVNVNNEEKIFWRLFSTATEDAIKKIKEIAKPRVKTLIAEKKAEKQLEAKGMEKKVEKVAEKLPLEFPKRVYDYIEKEDIKMIEEIEKRKKELLGKISINSSIGRIEMLLIARDKKTITEDDLNLALSKGSSMKLPVLFLSTGKMNKKALGEIENFKSYLIFKQIVS